MQNSPSFAFDGSSGCSPEEAYETWRGLVSVLFEASVADVEAINAFRIKIDGYHLGPVLIGRTESVAQRFRRSATTVARSGVDHFCVQFYSRGGYAGEAEGRSVDVRPGDISILDLSRTLHTQAKDFRSVTMVVPRPLLAPLLKNPDGLHGMVLPRGSGINALLGNYMRTLHATAASLTTTGGSEIAEATARLIAGCFGAAPDAQEATVATRRRVQVIAVRRYIDENLADPRLSVASLSREFRLSRATLARMFEPLGGLAGYIRERRLVRCFGEITSPAHAHRLISDIAYGWGFSNDAAFSRAFRRMFGMSPREARFEASPPQRRGYYRMAGATGPDETVLAQWVRHLPG